MSIDPAALDRAVRYFQAVLRTARRAVIEPSERWRLQTMVTAHTRVIVARYHQEVADQAAGRPDLILRPKRNRRLAQPARCDTRSCVGVDDDKTEANPV